MGLRGRIRGDSAVQETAIEAMASRDVVWWDRRCWCALLCMVCAVCDGGGAGGFVASGLSLIAATIYRCWQLADDSFARFVSFRLFVRSLDIRPSRSPWPWLADC